MTVKFSNIDEQNKLQQVMNDTNEERITNIDIFDTKVSFPIGATKSKNQKRKKKKLFN